MSDCERHIVAMGGGGFSMEPKNQLLDDFVLSLTGRERPKVCFLPTASGDSDGYVTRFHGAFPPARAEATHLLLFSRTIADLRGFVLDQDVVYVGGGATANMLAVWRVHGLHKILREARERGVILCGLSAGMVCWFEGTVTDSFGKYAALCDGLGLIPGSACPHYDGDPERRSLYLELVASGGLAPGVAADDGVRLHYVGETLAEAVGSRPAARAYSVTANGEQPVPTRFLG